MITSVEIFFVQYNNDKQAFQYMRSIVQPSDVDPDHVVIDYLNQYHPAAEARYISHSTSWHYEKPSHILLTYVVMSEYFELDHPIELGHHHPITSGTWQKPRPEELGEGHVLSHGLRHIAFLLHKNSEPSWLNPQTLRALHKLHPSLAGEILP